MRNFDEKQIIQQVLEITTKLNIDNISRTYAYESFYFDYKEIKWSLLASLVSRNAGWNMCDLEGNWMPKVLSVDYRNNLFSMYERANWLIFQDAFPQLLLYHYSTRFGRPLFHLLTNFFISNFMMREWECFWENHDETRLLYALIINEQNLIQKPVITHSFYQKKIFQSLPYYTQDLFHFNIIIFPTKNGHLFGRTVENFQKVDERINLGKQLAWILFQSGELPNFIRFIKSSSHTGSRFDYEKYLKNKNNRDTPYLRMTYPIIEHERNLSIDSWDHNQRIKKSWFKQPKIKDDILITNWYLKKRKEMEVSVNMLELFKLKGNHKKKSRL